MLGRGGKEATAAGLEYEMFKIFRGLEAQEGQPKSVLAARFSVASPSIAAGLGEDGNDLIGEVDRFLDLKLTYLDLDRGAEAAVMASGEGGLAVSLGLKPTALVNANDAAGLGLEGDAASEILGCSLLVEAAHLELATIPLAQEREHFLNEEWPKVLVRLKNLDIDTAELPGIGGTA